MAVGGPQTAQGLEGSASSLGKLLAPREPPRSPL